MFSLNLLSRPGKVAALLVMSALCLNAQFAPQPTAVLRGPPLPSISQKVNAFGYATDTNQMIQFLALLTLGRVGYPMFPGASQTENAGVVCFESGAGLSATSMRYAMLVKFDANSSIPGRIKAEGIAVKNVAGWTVIAPDQTSLSYVSEGNIEEILRLLRKERSFDFEFEMVQSPANLLSTGAKDPGAAYLRNIDTGLVGLSLDQENFQLGIRQVAHAGTPEAALFSAKAGGDVPVARFVPATGNAGLIYHVDPVAVSDYLKVFFQRMEVAGESAENAKVHDKLEETLKTIAHDWDGTGAYRLEFEPEMMHYAGVIGGDWEQEPFSQLLDELFNEIVPAMLTEVPVQEYASAVQTAAGASQTGPVSSALPGALGNVVAGSSLNTLDQYEPPSHQIVDGMIVVSDQPAQLEALAAAVAADETAETSLADKLTLNDGEALSGYIDLKQIYLQSLRQMRIPNTPSTNLMLRQLGSMDLPPMHLNVQTGSNTLTGTLTIPVETIRTLSGTLQGLRQNVSEQRMQ